MSRGRGRGRGKTFGGPRSLLPADLSLGSLSYNDVLSTAHALRSRSGGAQDLWDPDVPIPDSQGPDAHERREARWGTQVALGNGMGGLVMRGGKYWLAVGASSRTAAGKGKAKQEEEPWLYSEKYKDVSASTDPASKRLLPLLAPPDKALLDKAFFPPDLWSSYYSTKPLSSRKRRLPLANGQSERKKTRIGVEGLVGQFEDAEDENAGGEGKEDEDGEGQPEEEDEGEEEDVRFLLFALQTVAKVTFS